MIDIGFTKLVLIGGIALVVIGPERLPRVARTLGTLLGRAQRYVADVKAEVSRSIEIDELKKMKDTVQGAAHEFGQSIQTEAADFEKSWNDVAGPESFPPLLPQYRHPNKKWRLKRSALPRWYKARAGIRANAMSGAARVARFRPRARTDV